jgi:hypothetical protein
LIDGQSRGGKALKAPMPADPTPMSAEKDEGIRAGRIDARDPGDLPRIRRRESALDRRKSALPTTFARITP